MKIYHRLAPLLLSVSAMSAPALLVSCVDPGYSGGGGYSSGGGGLMVHDTLPSSFAGSAYHYNGRYYSGGSYQTGMYNDRGRTYTNRYLHNGRYYYGGDYQQHRAKVHQNSHRDYERDSHGDYSHDRYRSNSQRPAVHLRPR